MSPSSDAPVRPATVAGRARWALLLGTAAVVLGLDQLTKWWALDSLPGRVVEVVWTLRFRLAINYGSAFSVAQGRGALISLLALVIVAVLLRSGRYATRPASALAIGLVVGGALGNLIDRAVRAGDGFLGGGVVDFVDLQWWPVFNVADAAIVVGAALLFLTQLRDDDAPDDEPSP
ncbi:MAG TPA: signal peptidase II [Acidimicrobiales bacterium]|nr:signal peptidase II [Acidimicrobiales bacterium]